MNGITLPLSIDVLVLCPFCQEKTWVLTSSDHIEIYRDEEPEWTEGLAPTYFKTAEQQRLNRYEYIPCCDRARLYNAQAAMNRRVSRYTGYLVSYLVLEIADIEVPA